MRNTGISRRFFSTCACCEGLAPAAGLNRDNAPISRRNFVIGGVAALGLGAVASAGVPAQTFAQAKPRRIDVHHHLSPPPWVDALKKAGLDTPPVTSWTPQRSLDEHGSGRRRDLDLVGPNAGDRLSWAQGGRRRGARLK